jgi:serine/threonine protein kinase
MTDQLGFPTRVEYNTAIVNHKATFRYPRLQEAVPQRASNGTYIIGGGAYAVVSKISIAQEQWALRLPTAKQNGADARYKAIAAEVASGNDLFVKVIYAPDGIEAPVGSGFIRPVVLMEWVNGAVVRDFVIEACEIKDVHALQCLRDAFIQLAGNMHRNGVSHGDLSPDNIIVDQTGDEIRLQLVDYDSVQIEKTGPLPSSVPLTPMRHPGGPIIADLHSDALPFLIYFGVLTALINNPELGKNPDNYDQKFLIDSQIARNGLEDEMMQQLHKAAPEEIDRIVEALKNPYDQTPQIFEEAASEVTPETAIISSDWMELIRQVDKQVTIHGFVKEKMADNKFLIRKHGVFSQGGKLSVVLHKSPKTPIQVGDEILVTGELRRKNDEYMIHASQLELKSNLTPGEHEVGVYSHLRTRINEALQRIRSQRY